jgi:protein tyrosine/serine phosphatase
MKDRFAQLASKGLTRTLAAGVIFIGLTAGSIGGYWGAVQYKGNFHTVEEGAFYRSAQLSKAELQTAIREHRIKAILNLRGAHPGEPWYDDEVAVSKALGVAHYNYGLSAYRFVTDQQIADLLGIVRAAPKPLLVHCKSGADRAGLVSALYRHAVEGASTEEADGQLSLAYGHFPYLMSRSRAMDDSFWAFVAKESGDSLRITEQAQEEGPPEVRPGAQGR